MKKISEIDFSDTPGIKGASKIFLKALLRKFYINPVNNLKKTFQKENIKAILYRINVNFFQLPVDTIIYNKEGMEGAALVASYTDKDKGYLDGFIESGRCFEIVILYHDKGGHNFKFNESLRFQKLIAAAKRDNATWVFIGSPKTRFSADFKKQVYPILKKYVNTQTVLSVKERYLWGDFDHFIYTREGGEDARIKKFFALTDKMVFDNKQIHASQFPINYKNVIDANASRYYLGRFNIDTMKKKAEFYHKKDGKDYSYLYDVSEPIAHGEKITGIGEYERRELLQ